MSNRHDGLTDQNLLASVAYANPAAYQARQSLYRWQTPRHDLPALVLAEMPDGPGLVVDVGCGSGTYVKACRAARPELTVLGVDLAEGMLRGIPPPVVVADAARLPFPDGRADGVLAMHMLYHLADVEAGIAELKRVVRPGGTVVVSTNATSDKVEIQRLWQQIAADAGVVGDRSSVSFSARFPLERAHAALARQFARTTLIELRSVIDVPIAAPVVDYFRSYVPVLGYDGATAARVIAAAEGRVRDVIARAGSFRITCAGGLIVCT